MEMPSIDGYTVTRRELLRYGAGGAAALALGVAPSASLASLRARRATPKKGGTLKFARSGAPTQLDPSRSIIAPDVYTLDKIFEPLFIASVSGAHAVARAELHGEQGQQDVHLQASSRRQVLRRVAPDRRRRGLLDQSHVQRQEGRARGFLDFAIKPLSPAAIDGRRPPHPAVGALRLGHLGVRERDLPTNFGGKSRDGVLREPDRHRPVHAAASSPTPRRGPSANKPYWQAGKPYVDAVEFINVGPTTTSACCSFEADRST